ncbi:MAG TPA: helix-turn-helix domain-containing protein [Mesorhizobium sp.]|nr:helix-turn-helix domain-containing protein [Mesorhizobium sp.]
MERRLQSHATDLPELLGAGQLLAQDLRALRKARGLTLQEVALKLGRSVGWASQVERGISSPSIADLSAMARLLGVPLSLFFAHEAASEAERGVIVRADRRRRLGSSDSGLAEELLSPDLGGGFEILRSEFAGGAELAAPALRATEEAGYLVSGRFDIEIDGAWHKLSPGDSFRFREKPFRWRNPGAEPAVVIWVVSPPVY